MTKQSFVESLTLEHFLDDMDTSIREDLLDRITYLHFDPASHTSADFLHGIHDVRRRYGCISNFLVYLALPTAAFLETAQLIGALAVDRGWRRVVFEKPFGEDLASAVQLNRDINSVLDEQEI